MRFSGSVVLVAGGTGGLGRAVSLALLQEDARVVVTYRNEEEFIALRSAAASNGSLLEGRRVDVTEEASVAQLVDGMLAEYGQLDAMVNTVGAYAGGVKFWDVNTKVFDQMLALNLRPGLLLARAAVPAMLKRGRGA